MRRIFALGTLLVAAACACSAKPEDAESQGKELCEKIEACPDTYLTVSVEECTRQFDQELATLPKECVSCIDQITCGGWAEWNAGNVTISNLCPACPETAG